jgi:hypothetical protein
MRKLNDAQIRHVLMKSAPEMALSGSYRNAQEIALKLRKDGIDAGRYFSAGVCVWLDELCQRALPATPAEVASNGVGKSVTEVELSGVRSSRRAKRSRTATPEISQ